MIEVKTEPRQTVPQLISKLGISRSQYYKDRDDLKAIGFKYDYSSSKKRFNITADKDLPVNSLTLTERLSLIMAFRQLSAAGDHILTFDGFDAAKKLAAELPEPLRESLFDDIVLKKGFGCERQIMDKLRKAVNENRRVTIIYQKPESDNPEAHQLDPYHLFFRRRALYIEGHSYTENGIRMYRLNRIKSVELTPMGFSIDNDYDFGLRHKNAFSAFPGETTQHVKIRFSRQARPFIEESLWHHSQETTKQKDGTLIFEVDVAQPREVMWWSFFWGAGSEILEPGWLRQEAKEEIGKMGEVYGPFDGN